MNKVSARLGTLQSFCTIINVKVLDDFDQTLSRSEHTRTISIFPANATIHANVKALTGCQTPYRVGLSRMPEFGNLEHITKTLSG